MAWLIPSIMATLAGTAILGFCYYYLFLQDPKNYLKIWTISWAIYFFRYVFMLAFLIWMKTPVFLIGNQVSTLISGILLLYGTYLFIDKKFPRIFLYLSVLGTGWIVFSVLNGLTFLATSLPTFSFLAAIYIWTGHVFLKHYRYAQKEAKIVGWAFIVWGIHKANYPFLRPVIWFAPWGYLLGAILEFITALGLILIYFRKTKNELLDNQNRLLEAQKTAKIGDWSWQLEKNELVWSDETYRIFGQSPETFHVTVESFEKAIHPDDYRAFLAEREAALNENRAVNIEHRIVLPDNRIRWVHEISSVIKNETGEIVKVTGTVQDITQRKKSEAEREELQSQLLQSHKMESVGRLAGGVAHDFNNMLGVILGHVEFAFEKTGGNQDLYADLVEIKKAAQRSADLTKQLLTFARKQIIEPKVLDLNHTVENALSMLRRLIGEDIDLSWRPAGQLWPVKIDPSQVDQILANLCVNARDAISGVGKLTIETQIKTLDSTFCEDHAECIPGDYVMLAVTDNGCGMDRETRNNLFEPFFTTKDVGEGTGLGLAIIYGIVKQNNGFISVYSEPAQGTTFKIYLPRFHAAEEPPEKTQPEKPVPIGDETILLVEDEPAILRMTRMMLERKGYSVLAAGTPTEAVNTARAHAGSIHLLMTDVVMPEMNGADLAEKISAVYPEIKTLFMSGYTANVIAHQGVLDDGVAFIQKPFSINELAEKIREVLDGPSGINPP